MPGTSNPGTLTSSAGGVARNIAENLARLGTSVTLVAPVGTDPFGDRLRHELTAVGIDADHLIPSPHATGTYLAVLDEGGDLVTGVSDMAACELLRPEDMVEVPLLLPQVAMLVLDGNLPAPVIGWLLAAAEAAQVRVVIDPVSVAKATRLAPELHHPVFLLTPNADELRALASDTHLDPAADPLAAQVEALRQRGVEWVWVRQGGAGSLLWGPGVEALAIPIVPSRVVDVTGAGDSMTAGFVHAWLAGATPPEAAQFGALVASATVASPHTVRPDLIASLARPYPEGTTP